MSDSILPDEPTPEVIEATLAEDVQKARENFTLVDLFGPTPQRILPEKKRIIIRDMEAALEYENATHGAQHLRVMYEAAAKPKTAADKKAYAEMLKRVEEAEAKAADLKAKMLETALVFFLRAYPNIALKVGKRDARKIFFDPHTKALREDVTDEEVSEWLQQRMMGEMIVKVTDSHGGVVEFGRPKAEIGEFLSDNLHPVQWGLLLSDYDELVARAGIAGASLEDPGF